MPPRPDFSAPKTPMNSSSNSRGTATATTSVTG